MTTSHDGAWYDRMYNNRALVPEFAMHFARWNEASQDTREAHRCFQDVAYGRGPNESLDIFPSQTPVSAQGAPVVIFIHGGYWRSLDKSDHSFVVPPFTAQGACVLVPNYALCPAVTIPDIVMQMVKATVWAYRNVHRFGGDPSCISVIGHSAGGHLATMMLACDWLAYDKTLPKHLVHKAMSMSGLYELESVRATPFLTDSLRLTESDAVKVSPAWMPAPQKGSLTTVVGALESEEFLRHNRLIQKSWGNKVVPVCEDILGTNHFSILEELSFPGSRVQTLASQLLT